MSTFGYKVKLTVVSSFLCVMNKMSTFKCSNRSRMHVPLGTLTRSFHCLHLWSSSQRWCYGGKCLIFTMRQIQCEGTLQLHSARFARRVTVPASRLLLRYFYNKYFYTWWVYPFDEGDSSTTGIKSGPSYSPE